MLTMRSVLGLVALTACAVPDEVHVSSAEQQGVNMQGVNMQGVNMQGVNMQGVNMQGVNMQGFALDGVTLGSPLSNARIEKGELVAQRGATTLRGTALAGAHLFGEFTDTAGVSASIEFRIASVAAESAAYDPTKTGNTYLYRIEYADDAGTWRPACGADANGQHVAIPIAATFDGTGARVATPGMFTFGCTTGVIAKCYRWGYRRGSPGTVAPTSPTFTGHARGWRAPTIAVTAGRTRATGRRSMPGIGCQHRGRSRSTGCCRRSACCSRPAGIPVVRCA